MSKMKTYNYTIKVILNIVGVLLGLFSMVFSTLSNELFNIGLRTDWIFMLIGFIILMYFAVWNLKCPYCNHGIDIRGALYISKCPHCGKNLK